VNRRPQVQSIIDAEISIGSTLHRSCNASCNLATGWGRVVIVELATASGKDRPFTIAATSHLLGVANRLSVPMPTAKTGACGAAAISAPIGPRLPLATKAELHTLTVMARGKLLA
jgi:hypothetical protein